MIKKTTVIRERGTVDVYRVSNDYDRLRRFVVMPSGEPLSVEGALGVLEKYKSTRTEKHPWKAFKHCGYGAVYLDAFYGDHERSGYTDAIDAILNA